MSARLITTLIICVVFVGVLPKRGLTMGWRRKLLEQRSEPVTTGKKLYAHADPLERCPPQLNRGAYLKTHGDKCYEFVTYDERTWNVAKTACATQGGSLAAIGDKNTQQFLVNSLKQLDYEKKGLWIGLSDSQNEGTWRWVTGDTMSYSNWASGHGGFLGFVEDCALIRSSDGKWVELPCGVFWDKFGFICQYDMVPLSSRHQ